MCLFQRELNKATAQICSEKEIISHADNMLWKLNHLKERLDTNIAKISKISQQKGTFNGEEIQNLFAESSNLLTGIVKDDDQIDELQKYNPKNEKPQTFDSQIITETQT